MMDTVGSLPKRKRNARSASGLWKASWAATSRYWMHRSTVHRLIHNAHTAMAPVRSQLPLLRSEERGVETTTRSEDEVKVTLHRVR